MSKQFYFKQFRLAYVHSLVLFDFKLGPYQVLPIRVTGVLYIPQNSR